MKRTRVQVTKVAPRESIFLMADTSHPEVDPFTTVDDADALILVCHPDNERAVRDALAIEQERPHWWRDMRRIEAALASREQGAS